MDKLEYEFCSNVPVYKCSFCGKCSSFIESTSYTSIKTRGCCWYFPKYSLIDMKNIIDSGNKNFIYSLLNMDNAEIYQYCINVNGEFNKKEYEEYLKETFQEDSEVSDFDQKLFFRLCPFATTKGCSIAFDLRPHPCNLYLCREVINSCGKDYKEFSKERKDYYSYCNYYSDTLKYILMDNTVDLTKDPFKAIDILEKTEIPTFEFKNLKPIIFNADLSY
ncbi:hypothetical protein CLHOM_09470 [Clostridium homopropionicum DSM 5847]|uniref:Uncharacterized protein n=1 Tax=Clostridium homopropionicum DSM 5847 TaxID=1121318 RepID=A0A0L6ZCV1_9CLOT|nr:hypothetical protein [Clostridium homopropionicum]KOA20804.1 hypothetical protein CLHOM_09470 [Clostridium homopropionicum DSM 5847]SFF88738.1 hypothetical protein SAMN04488501_10350 [Clostridium homopropionicum]